MLIIRDLQLTQFALGTRHQFTQRMCITLRENFPFELQAVDSDNLYKHIEAQLDRAAAYGFDSERDVCLYLNLAVACGWSFDQSPQNAWMHVMLNDQQVSTPSDRIRRLYDEYCHRCEVEENNRLLFSQFEGKTSHA
ncbi:hypothetical protein [Pseudomonas fluorescens]|uniref:Uncharacterized protein n=1 Tax=Pseudomonas fluorescens TaxID=294 RepID=A0A423LRG9_PSEFL|nr:hypothetical protein [Pseudomonas fluorescens]RON70897.1 hypothetical protein BK671_05030 [Pseudomonas fluorescens]